MSATLLAPTARGSTAIVIGGVTVRLRASDPRFLQLIDERYEKFRRMGSFFTEAC